MRHALAVLFLFASGCDSAARTETQQLSVAVERFRRAENPEKPSHVDAIERSPCTDAEVCAAKAVCLESARATAKGLTLTARANRTLDHMMKASQAEDVHRMLDEAKASNELGMKKLLECDDKLVALRRKHGV